MNRIAQELDEKLKSLDPTHAQELETLVRNLLERAETKEANGSASRWPEGYFEATAGVLAGEEFERPPQGELPDRDEW